LLRLSLIKNHPDDPLVTKGSLEMTRPSFKTHHLRRLAIFFLFALSVLYLVSSSRPWAAARNSASQSQSNPQLTLNLTHVTNADDPLPSPGDPPASTTWFPGIPITYVISLSNSGGANSNISVADAAPVGFVFVGATCTAFEGATCPTNPLTPPTFGTFSFPERSSVEIRITGYFTAAGPMVNTATATANDANGNPLNVGTSNSSRWQLAVSPEQSPVNVEVTKSVEVKSPTHLRYTIIVANLPVANKPATGVYLGGNQRLIDYLGNVAFSWTVSSPTCTPSPGADCPDVPSSVKNNTTQIPFLYDLAGASTLNDSGWLPAGGSYKIEYDVDKITTIAACGEPKIDFPNLATLDNNAVGSFRDWVRGDDRASVTTAISTGLSPCPATQPTATKIQCTTETNQCDPGTTANWNEPVRYRITVSNPTSKTLTNIRLVDQLFKYHGTPTFTAIVRSKPTCLSGCSTIASEIANPAPTLILDGNTFLLWSGTLPSLAPSESAVFDYTVEYVPNCETDPTPDQIGNRIRAGSVDMSLFDYVTNMATEAALCEFRVQKTMAQRLIAFKQPTTYAVEFSNLSTASLAVTVRDALSISSDKYADLPFTYSTTCEVTKGTITDVPPPIKVRIRRASNSPRRVSCSLKIVRLLAPTQVLPVRSP
jgi:uncharacterized repeat protein (TIGR01451 family)